MAHLILRLIQRSWSVWLDGQEARKGEMKFDLGRVFYAVPSGKRYVRE